MGFRHWRFNSLMDDYHVHHNSRTLITRCVKTWWFVRGLITPGVVTPLRCGNASDLIQHNLFRISTYLQHTGEPSKLSTMKIVVIVSRAHVDAIVCAAHRTSYPGA